MMEMSEEAVSAVVPIAVYWGYSGVHMALGHAGVMDKYRLNTKEEEDSLNTVSKRAVFLNILMQHLMQLASIALLDTVVRGETQTPTNEDSYLTVAARMVVAAVVFDAYRYFWHRFAHRNRFIYRHLHYWHHCILVPYAFGAFYGHPIEALIEDTGSGLLAILVSGMSPRATAVFFSICNIQGINLHCGLNLMPRRLQSGWNSAAYHAVHHMPRGIRYNFSDSFFIMWDKVLGTDMPYDVHERPASQGLIVKPMPRPKKDN